MYTIASLHELRRHLSLAADDSSADDDLLRSLQEASHYIESTTQRRYCPRLATMRAADIDTARRGEIVLPDDLLELQKISDQSGEIDTGRIRRLPQDADLPASILQIQGGIAGTLSIRGIWGWHDRWTTAWRGSDDSLASAVDADATLLSIADATGLDATGASPRFQVGHLLRIAAEYLRIIDIDSEGSQLTVLRGVNGTTASEHVSGLEIDIYAPPPTIADLCLRYAEQLDAQQHPAAALGLSLYDRVRVSEAHTGHSARDYFIVGEAHEVGAGGAMHKLRWTLEPADMTRYFIIDSSRIDASDEKILPF